MKPGLQLCAILALATLWCSSATAQEPPSAPPAEAEDATAEQAAEELAAAEEAPVATDTEPAEQVQFAYVVAPDLVEAAHGLGHLAALQETEILIELEGDALGRAFETLAVL